jgi:hypothetical protein
MWFSFRIGVRLIARGCAHGGKRKVSLGPGQNKWNEDSCNERI